MKKVLITGSSGLIGSEAVNFFLKKNFWFLVLITTLDQSYLEKTFYKKIC